MKAHYRVFTTETQIREEIGRQLDEAFQHGKEKAVDICAIALNEEFGFGRDRLKKLNNMINSLIDEYNGYAELREGIADEKIKQRLKQIGVSADAE